jgi:hypothetical protein
MTKFKRSISNIIFQVINNLFAANELDATEREAVIYHDRTVDSTGCPLHKAGTGSLANS